MPTWLTVISVPRQPGSDGVNLSPAGLTINLLEENKQIFVIDWRLSCFVFKTRLHFFLFQSWSFACFRAFTCQCES